MHSRLCLQRCSLPSPPTSIQWTLQGSPSVSQILHYHWVNWQTTDHLRGPTEAGAYGQHSRLRLNSASIPSVPASSPAAAPQVVRTTRSGRCVHWPDRLVFWGGSVCSVLHHLHMHILSLLFPVAHYFIIISYVHDYSPFTSTFTLITQCLIVLLYPCSIVVVFCCYAPVYITVCTSCNNLQLTISVQSYNAYHYNRILHLSLTSKAEGNLCTWCIVYAIWCQ